VINNNFTTALYALYPEVVSTDGDKAFNAQGNQVQYDPVYVQDYADCLSCSDQAKSILSTTDWTSIPDVGNPTASSPYLINQSEFIAYRSQIRTLAINPVANPVWPTPPTEQWSS
jgi:hypothetical protein